MRKFILYLTVLMALSTAAAAQKAVTGKVVDEKDGSPIIGASIRVKNGAILGTTNEAGGFNVNVPANARTLVFTFVGYTELEAGITSGEMLVSMKQSTQSLNEVVVTGYQTRSRRANTGSVSVVSIDDIRTQPNASFDQMLQGQAPGINVKTGSGQPGRNADVVIRGKGSINGSNAPLYIMDGVEIRAGDFSTLNQNDFESVTILKDAASTAIYGSRGANGVIVITTKKGRAGKLRLSYDGQIGTARLPENQLKLMNTQEKLDFEMNIAGNPWGWAPEDVEELRKINTNWNDYVFRNAGMQSHQISASGGTDKTTFFTSLGMYDEEGITVGTGIKKYNGRINVSHTDNNIKIGANLAGGWSNYTGTFEGDQSIGSALNTVIWALPYEKAYNDDGSYGESVQFPFWINPVEDLLENPNRSWQLKGTGNVFLEYKLPWIKNLTYRINAGGDYSQLEGFSIVKNGTQSARQNEAFGQDFRRNGEIARSLERRFRYTVTNSLNYRTTLDQSGDHNLSATVFTEFVKNTSRDFDYTAYGLLLPFDNEAGLVPGTADNGFIPVVGGGFPENNALMSYFGQIDYSFKNRYFLSLTGRTDGSSKLSPENRWTQYGSVGASWILSDENFYKLDFMNYLKLKASYGSVGNQNGIGDFPYLQQYGRGSYGGRGSLSVNRLGNNLLTWEIRSTLNVGADMEFFQSRLRASVEWYSSLTKGLYFSPFVPSTSGGNGTLLSNNGSMRNRGIEATLGVKIINTRDFKWSVDMNYAYNKNVIVSLPDGQDFQLYKSQALQVGKPFNSFYLVRFAGVNPENGNSQYYKADGKTITEQYDANDLVVLGTSDAPHNAGITTTINYKGIELSAFGVYSAGNYIYNNARFNVEYNGYTTSGFSKNALNAWTTPGQVTNFPRLSETTEGSTTRFLEKGDFFRLRNVQLAYTLPAEVVSRLKIQGFRIFVQGQNLYTSFKFQGWDPEVSTVTNADVNSNAAVSGAQYPSLKRVTVGVNLTL
ncbi:TonB-dependent receptor [Flavihumibacter sp. CACIAM 22H1]|uniref:SusC/RagA family TonB-linked outer membrane protein n=1 Tax=Flavihumibacter sp. CACIAM 22H1 TaxID=1812911 RepID=UPI000B2CB096|nr:TonB-dependent receptor [Flavihumibacter sp. CACIAM 22H1]